MSLCYCGKTRDSGGYGHLPPPDNRTVTGVDSGVDGEVGRMGGARSAAAVRAAGVLARCYLRPVRRTLTGTGRAASGTFGVRLGPVEATRSGELGRWGSSRARFERLMDA
jgi:hypothetical protein